MYPPVMREFWRGFLHIPEEEKPFVLTNELLVKSLDEIVADDSMREALLSLANSESSKTKFKVERFTEGVRVLVGKKEPKDELFKVGIGKKSLYYINKYSIPGREVHKFQPKNMIFNEEDLKHSIEGFILLGPFWDQIIDVRKETLLEKMNVAQYQPEQHNFEK